MKVHRKSIFQATFMSKSKFWPLDYNPEGAIYDNLSWDLPGYRPNRARLPKQKRREVN